jgi:hypothetical protein
MRRVLHHSNLHRFTLSISFCQLPGYCCAHSRNWLCLLFIAVLLFRFCTYLLSHKCSCCPFLCFVPNWHDKKYLVFGSGQFLSWLDSFEATQLIWNPDALYGFFTSCRETLWRAWLAIQSCVIFFRWSFASVWLSISLWTSTEVIKKSALNIFSVNCVEYYSMKLTVLETLNV